MIENQSYDVDSADPTETERQQRHGSGQKRDRLRNLAKTLKTLEPDDLWVTEASLQPYWHVEAYSQVYAQRLDFIKEYPF